MWGWGESEASPRNEKVEMVPPIETSLDPKNPSYSNVQELQPILLKQSNTNPYQLDFLVCRICKHFAINPRQCCVCKALTCSECANRTENPQICPNCIEHGYLQGLLGKPNLLEGKAAELAETVSFVCPYKCGRRDLKFQEMQQHVIWFCEDKPLETKT